MPILTSAFGRCLLRIAFFAGISGFYTAFLYIPLSGDFTNYHYYIGYAFLNERINFDIAPANLRSFFTPTLDGLFYYLSQKLPYFWFKLVAGAFSGVALYWVWEIANLIFSTSEKSKTTTLMMFSALLFGISGHLVLAQLGRWGGEPIAAPFALGGLYFLLRASVGSHVKASHLVLSGVLIGACIGLKLVGIYLAVGYGAACLYLSLASRRWSLVIYAGGALIVGVLVVSGYWYWTLFLKFENPVFPIMNSVFQSPWAHPNSNFEVTKIHTPNSFFEWVVAPFSTLELVRLGNQWHRDLHLPILFSTAILALVLSARDIVKWRIRRPTVTPLCVLYIFFFVGYYAWSYQFSIVRYLYELQLVSGIILVALLRRVFSNRVVVCTTSLCLAIISAVVTYQYARGVTKGTPLFLDPGAAYSAKFLELGKPVDRLPSEGVVIIPGMQPQAFVIPLLPAELRFVGIGGRMRIGSGSDKMSALARSVIQDNLERLYVLYPNTRNLDMTRPGRYHIKANRALKGFDLRLVKDSCFRLEVEMSAQQPSNSKVLFCKVSRRR